MRNLILLFTFISACSIAFCDDVTVAELRNRMPIGELGKPLGTQLTLTGAWPKQAQLIANAMEVTEINGKRLLSPIQISIRGNPQIREGVNFRLEGYEAGEFSGDPGWFNPRVQQPFQYRVFFVVTKVIEPQSK